MMNKMRSVLVRFRMGGFGGIRGPTMEETIESLRVHGFPKELDKEIQKILKEIRDSRSDKTHHYLIEDSEQDLLILLENWQRKKRKEMKMFGI